MMSMVAWSRWRKADQVAIGDGGLLGGNQGRLWLMLDNYIKNQDLQRFGSFGGIRAVGF